MNEQAERSDKIETLVMTIALIVLLGVLFAVPATRAWVFMLMHAVGSAFVPPVMFWVHLFT